MKYLYSGASQNLLCNKKKITHTFYLDKPIKEHLLLHFQTLLLAIYNKYLVKLGMYSLFIQYYSFKNSVRIRGRGNSSNLSLSFTHFRISALQSSSKVPTVEMNRSILKEFYIIMLTQIITLSSLRCHTKAIRTPKIQQL